MYKFSAPMPYTKQDIDKILEINNQVQKSKITSLYACVPRGCEVFTGFEQSRNFSFDNVSWDYWKSLIEHTLNKGGDFIYLLNSPRPLDIDNPDFPKQLDKLDLLLTTLREVGIYKLRVASTQLMSYIGQHYSDFDILASTSLEYKTIWEYQNFITFHPEVKQIVPSCDTNKNFKLLSYLTNRHENVEIELIVNEGCLQGCPNRNLHELINIDKEVIINNEVCLSGIFPSSFCNPVVKKYPIQSLLISTLIFPWDIYEYEKIGITNFKLVGRDAYNDFNKYLHSYTLYLKGVDNPKNIENWNISTLTHHLINNPILKQLTIKEFKKYIPKIQHFTKYGHLCSSRCGTECKYCYNCSRKMEKALSKFIQKKSKAPHYVPACIIDKVIV